MKRNKKFWIHVLLFISIIGAFACGDDEEEPADPKPEIEVIYPSPCDTLNFGDEFRFKARFKDKTELGNYKINIHNNFDHHTHGTHDKQCILDEKKEAENPYLNNWVIEIPDGQTEYEIDTLLTLPLENEKGNYQKGDYHLMLYLTNSEGFQSWIGRDLKIWDSPNQ